MIGNFATEDQGPGSEHGRGCGSYHYFCRRGASVSPDQRLCSSLFNQSQLDARSIEIQNQCMILSSQMTRTGVSHSGAEE